MQILLILSAMILACAILEKATERSHEKRFFGFDYAVFFLALIFGVLITNRDFSVGIDSVYLYEPVFNEINDFLDFVYVPESYYSYDSQIFWFLMYVTKFFGFSYSGFSFFIFFIVLVVGFFSCKYSGIKFSIFVAIYFSTLLFLMSTTNTMRQGVALIFFFLYCAFLFKEKFFSAAISAFALTFMHGSGIVVVFVPLLGKLVLFLTRSEAKNKTLTIVAAVSVFAFFANLSEYMFSEKFKYYFVDLNYFSQKSALERPWVIASILLMIALTVYQIYGRIVLLGEKQKEWIVLYIVLVMVWLAFIPAPGVFERFGDYVAIVQVIFLSLFLSKLRNSAFLFAIFPVVFLFSYFNYFSEAVKLTVGL